MSFAMLRDWIIIWSETIFKKSLFSVIYSKIQFIITWFIVQFMFGWKVSVVALPKSHNLIPFRLEFIKRFSSLRSRWTIGGFELCNTETASITCKKLRNFIIIRHRFNTDCNIYKIRFLRILGKFRSSTWVNIRATASGGYAVERACRTSDKTVGQYSIKTRNSSILRPGPTWRLPLADVTKLTILQLEKIYGQTSEFWNHNVRRLFRRTQ